MSPWSDTPIGDSVERDLPRLMQPRRRWWHKLLHAFGEPETARTAA